MVYEFLQGGTEYLESQPWSDGSAADAGCASCPGTPLEASNPFVYPGPLAPEFSAHAGQVPGVDTQFEPFNFKAGQVPGVDTQNLPFTFKAISGDPESVIFYIILVAAGALGGYALTQVKL